MSLKIRCRQRRGYLREAQGYTGWTEWQLVDGRKVVGRYDFEAQAVAAKNEREQAVSTHEGAIDATP